MAEPKLLTTEHYVLETGESRVEVEYEDGKFTSMFIRTSPHSNGTVVTELEEARAIIELVADAGKLIKEKGTPNNG